MKSKRIAIVVHRFWPFVGTAENMMAQLAVDLLALGHAPTIVSAQWEPSWPLEIAYQNVPVVRLPQPQVTAWGTIRYLWSLTRWLRKQIHNYDAVLVSSLKYEAFTTLHSLQGINIPLILRAELSGTQGDCQWQATAHFGKRIQQACMQAKTIVAPTMSIQQELHAAGYSPKNILYIPNGVGNVAKRTATSRTQARAVLSHANPDFFTHESTRVILFAGDMQADSGIPDLIRAFRKLLDVWPDTRLWLIGDGPERDKLFSKICDLGLRHSVLMPGNFDHWTELIHAADVFIEPSVSNSESLPLLEALACELPVVASDTWQHRQLIEHAACGLLFPLKQPVLLAESIAHVFTQRDEALVRAQFGSEFIAQQRQLRRCTLSHIELIEKLLVNGSD